MLIGWSWSSISLKSIKSIKTNIFDNQAWRKKYLCSTITKFNFCNIKTFLYSSTTSTSTSYHLRTMFLTFQRELPRTTRGPTALRGNIRYIKVFLILFLCLYILVPFSNFWVFLVYIECINQRSKSLCNLIKNIPVSLTFLNKFCIVVYSICTVLHSTVLHSIV